MDRAEVDIGTFTLCTHGGGECRICAIAWNEDRAAMFRRKAERHEANAARLKALAVNSPSTAVAEHGTHTGETDG